MQSQAISHKLNEYFHVNILLSSLIAFAILLITTLVYSTAHAGTASNSSSTNSTVIKIKCDPRTSQPTNVVQSINFAGLEFSNDDGGYVPYSDLHQQGFDLQIAADKSVVLTDFPAKNFSQVLGQLSTLAACGWEETSVNQLTLFPILNLQVTLMSVGPVTSTVIDSQTQYEQAVTHNVVIENMINNESVILSLTTQEPVQQ